MKFLALRVVPVLMLLCAAARPTNATDRIDLENQVDASVHAGGGFSTTYGYVVRSTIVHGIERKPPDGAVPGRVSLFYLHGDGIEYPHADPESIIAPYAPSFDVGFTYGPDASILSYAFTIHPCK